MGRVSPWGELNTVTVTTRLQAQGKTINRIELGYQEAQEAGFTGGMRKISSRAYPAILVMASLKNNNRPCTIKNLTI